MLRLWCFLFLLGVTMATALPGGPPKNPKEYAPHQLTPKTVMDLTGLPQKMVSLLQNIPAPKPSSSLF